MFRLPILLALRVHRHFVHRRSSPDSRIEFNSHALGENLRAGRKKFSRTSISAHKWELRGRRGQARPELRKRNSFEKR